MKGASIRIGHREQWRHSALPLGKTGAATECLVRGLAMIQTKLERIPDLVRWWLTLPTSIAVNFIVHELVMLAARLSVVRAVDLIAVSLGVMSGVWCGAQMAPRRRQLAALLLALLVSISAAIVAVSHYMLAAIAHAFGTLKDPLLHSAVTRSWAAIVGAITGFMVVITCELAATRRVASRRGLSSSG